MLEEQKRKNEQLSQAFNALQASYDQLAKSRTGHLDGVQPQPLTALPYDMLMIGGLEPLNSCPYQQST